MEHATINRVSIIILPKQPALDWVKRIDHAPIEHLTLEEMRQEQEVYLLPEGLINRNGPVCIVLNAASK